VPSVLHLPACLGTDQSTQIHLEGEAVVVETVVMAARDPRYFRYEWLICAAAGWILLREQAQSVYPAYVIQRQMLRVHLPFPKVAHSQQALPYWAEVLRPS